MKKSYQNIENKGDLKNLALLKLGLSTEEITLYTILVEKGYAKASKLGELSGLKPGMTYKVLDSLIARDLVERRDKDGDIALFLAKHPKPLLSLLENKKNEIAEAEKLMEAQYKKLQTQYNMSFGLPNIQFFEGIDGIRKVLWDTLSVETDQEILTIADPYSVETYFRDLNQEYVKARSQKNIKKRLLIPDSLHTKKYLKDNNMSHITDVRIIEREYVDFESALEIYGSKIAFITVSEQFLIGAIIEDARISKMQTWVFNALYEKALTIDEYMKKEDI